MTGLPHTAGPGSAVRSGSSQKEPVPQGVDRVQVERTFPREVSLPLHFGNDGFIGAIGHGPCQAS